MDNLILSQIPLEDLLALVRQVVREEIAAGSPAPVVTKNNEKPINIKQLCAHLKITPPTARQLRKKGRILFFYLGKSVRFNLQEVKKALDNNTQKKGLSNPSVSNK